MTNEELMKIAEETAVGIAQDTSVDSNVRLTAANFLVNIVGMRILEEDN